MPTPKKPTGPDDQNPPPFTAEDIDEAFARIQLGDEEEQELTDAEIETVELTAEELAAMKGIPVIIPRHHGKPIKGKLVEWHDPHNCRVVWFDGAAFVTKTIKLDELKTYNPFLGSSLVKIQTSQSARNQLTSLLEETLSRAVRNREINNGGRAETLEEAVRTFRFADGIEGAAATCKAGYIYETEKDASGNEVPKNRNEDMWLVDPDTELVGVFDGMGGGKKAMKVAEIAATRIAENQNDIPGAAKQVQSTLVADKSIGNKDGVCFVTVKPTVGQPPEVHQCGDVDFYHFDSRGRVKYGPGQQMELGQEPQGSFEYLDSLIDNPQEPGMVEKNIWALAHSVRKKPTDEEKAGVQRIIDRITSGQRPVVESNNPMYTFFRKITVRALNKSESEVASFRTKEKVEEGDWMIVMSDGVSDNLTEGELERLVATAISQKWTPEQLVGRISRIVEERIKLANSEDKLAQQFHFKLDNATIIVMRVPKKEQQFQTETKIA